MKAMRCNTQWDWTIAEAELAKSPHDAAVQAEHLAAKKAHDEYGAAEQKALVQLGWDGKSSEAGISVKKKMAGMKVAA